MSDPSPYEPAVDLEADRYDAAVHAELTKLRAAVRAVRALHCQTRSSVTGRRYCTEDGQDSPCATERAIREAMGETE